MSQRYFESSRQPLAGISSDEFIALLEPKLAHAMSLQGLARRLDSGDPLNVKMGIDPTGPEIHLGHIVPVRVLDLFNRAGHNIDLIFGDFTAKIGDPSGRSAGRSVVTDEEISHNVTTYRDQVAGYFDTERPNVSVHRNSDWLGKLTLPQIFAYLQSLNLSEATQRKDFRDRISKGEAVSMAEAMYGTLQGIDSVHLQTDVEIGGIDQLLNVQQARAAQRQRGQLPEEILLTPIIEGTSGDGRKMSKSYRNYISAKAAPDEIFGKIMSIPDSHIVPYTVAFAPVRGHEMDALRTQVNSDPHEAKKQLGMFVVALSAGDMHLGAEARESFERRFSKKELQYEDAVPIRVISETTTLDALMKTSAYKSKSELRRLAKGGGIRINGTKVTEDELQQQAQTGDVIAVGKRKIFRIESEDTDS